MSGCYPSLGAQVACASQRHAVARWMLTVIFRISTVVLTNIFIDDLASPGDPTMRVPATSLLFILLAACAGPPEGAVSVQPPMAPVSDARLASAGTEPQNWLTHGGTQEEQRFSQLSEVNAGTVGRLGLAWSHEFDSNRGMEATPLVADGILYVTTAWSKLHALKADSGKLLWTFDPQVPGATGFKACCDVVNRGAALYDGKVYLATLDGRLVAVAAGTGRPVWSTLTVDQGKPYTITGAPRVVKGRVLIGNGGGEYGVRGYVSAYDAQTGRLAWRFYTVPPGRGAPADGAASDAIIEKMRSTWDGDWARFGGGGTVWDAIVYDQDFNQVLIGVGNGSPWDRRIRSNGKGDNLFLSSVVALDADTGAYKWHYQGVPGESWDFTQTQPIILATLHIDGEDRKVMMEAPKNGFFYVIDRRNGKLLSARNFVPQNWTTGIDPASGRPVEAKGARYERDPFLGLPSAHGAHNWQPMAYSPKTGLVYIPAQEVPLVYAASSPFIPRPGGWNLGVDLAVNKIPDDEASLKAIRALLKGRLIAWDPVRQRESWRVEHPGPWNGGVLATAGGLVFQGTAKGELIAYAAEDGRKLWSFDTGIGIIAPPISFAVGGKQYVAVLAGYGGAYAVSSPFTENAGPRPNGRLFVFTLGGKEPYTYERASPPPPVVPEDSFAPAAVARGAQIFETTCSVCHGATARSSGVMPDLRRSPILASQATWRQVVIGGSLAGRGMVSFSPWLSDADAEAVRAYVATRARHLAEAGN